MYKNLVNKHSTLNIISTLCLVVILAVTIYSVSHSYLDIKGREFLTKLTSQTRASENIVNIVIDDKSLNEMGRWPWPRNRYADMFDYLHTYSNAKAIVFDSLITAKGDSHDDKLFFQRSKNFDTLYWGMSFLNNSNYDSIQAGKLEQKYALNLKDLRKSKKKIYEYSSITNFLPEMISATHNVGSVLSAPDEDGVINNSEVIYKFKNKFYPSIALAVFEKYNNIREYELHDNYLLARNDSKSFKIPVNIDKKVLLKIKWYKPLQNSEKQGLYSHTEYSASDIIKSYEALNKGKKPTLDPKIFKNKIIVIGATATALYDIKITPFGVNYHGVDIQATNIDNMINNNFMTTMPEWRNIAIIIFMICLTLLFVGLYEPIISIMATFLTSLIFLLIVYFAYLNNYVIDYVTSLIFVLFVLGASYAYKFNIEGKKKEKIKNAMSKYISDDIMSEIIQNIDDVTLGGKRADVTILFADIRGFTTISEMYEPEEVSKILNNYFSEMIPIVNKYHGVLNKFIGDAILAVFGDPIPNENHAINAVLCADEMIKKVEELHKDWAIKGLPSLNIGVGINTGDVFAGNIGSNTRMEYTVIGDAVNVASRIESFNKIYKTKFLISESTYKKSKDFLDVIKISEVAIRGRSENINIYEVLKVNANVKYRN